MELIARESLVDAAAGRLRAAILGGELLPGQRIRVRELEERLGISHIPIREAIRQLEAEGLVVAPPRRAPRVTEVGLDDLTAIYELRRYIELPTARAAMIASGAEDVARVRAAYQAYEAVALQTRSPEYWRFHDDFHWAVLEAGANPWTRRVLEPLWRGAERYVRLFVLEYATAEATLDLHRLMMEAYASGEPERLVSVLEEHFEATETVVRAGFEASRGQPG